MTFAVKTQGLRKSFGSTHAIAGIDLEVEDGELVVLLGPSGCGKTTLLRAFAGLERPDAGTIAIAGAEVFGPGLDMEPARRGIGFVFQDLGLWPSMTALEHLTFVLGPDAADRKERARKRLADLRIEEIGKKKPAQISGGQAQRLALARALVTEPKLIFLDEPLSSLDPLVAAEIRRELARIHREEGRSMIYVTHSRDEAFELADRIVLMNEGRIVQSGTPEELAHCPANEFAARFLGCGSLLGARGGEGGIVETVLGRHRASGPGGEFVFLPRNALRLAADGESGTEARVTGSRFTSAGHVLELEIGEDHIEVPAAADHAVGDLVSVIGPDEVWCTARRSELMNQAVRLFVALLVIAGAYWAYLQVEKEPMRDEAQAAEALSMPDVSGLPALSLDSSESCAECHQEIYDEWVDSHHGISWTNPEPRKKELSDNFRNKDCIPCHAPRPMLEVGYGKRPLEREDRREDGVNCFTCHKYQNAMLTPNSLSPAAASAPCQPVTWEPVGELMLCAPCHDQHKVHQNWMRSRFAVEGPDYQDCNDCHMPITDGPGTKGSSKKTHRGHAFHGAHDAATLKNAATFRATRVQAGTKMAEAISALTDREFEPKEKVSGTRRVLVEVTNSGCGHNLPEDERHRAVDLYARFVPKGSVGGQEVRITRFRNPYRHEFEMVNPFKEKANQVLLFPVTMGDADVETSQVRLMPLFNPDRKIFYPDSTQLLAGETRLVWFDLPDLGPGTLELRLYYKLQPFMSNDDAVQMAAIDLEFHDSGQ